VTCAKQQVRATIIMPDGRRFVGTNAADNPQASCPRGDMPSNVGYELCRDVCQQPGHAEEMAIQAAGGSCPGARLYLEGHGTVCPRCLEACYNAGIRTIFIEPPPAEEPAA
jgi:deoxycytidylate deaminase